MGNSRTGKSVGMAATDIRGGVSFIDLERNFLGENGTVWIYSFLKFIFLIY